MTTPTTVLELVERFHRDIDAYKSGLYNETQARQEFIDPLFEALGWDIGNRQGAAAAYREVVLEYSMKIGPATKAPDYLFRASRANRFFVEAKKPAINLRDGLAPAYQVRRYAWTAGLPLSVLTDFDEFAIYDCRVEPNKADKASVARYNFYTYDQYADKWDEIAELFHRDAVLSGSLEKFAQEQKAPKGALPVDKVFLADIDAWRALLAKNIAIWNPELSQRELNYTVQMTLDRIIFLRITEDRGIEPYGKLQSLLTGGEIYKRLLNQFKDADDRYNSGLFHFDTEKGREAPDTLTPNIHIDDELLKKILKGLYYPDSPYEFSVLPVEVLGNTYEQFLGKVITIGADRKVEVEEKPEVRKAGGVYYTPSYIVDYIVKNTVGKLLDGKTAKEAEKLQILDPACGSGSFLIGAYQYLLDWYRDWYAQHGTARQRQEKLYEGPGGDWRLTTSERKRILLNNIYGVDIDAQAVEVTKLSLALKMLEGETSQSLATQLQMFQERALPDLGNNIKCGNSLIGPDFYDSPQASQLTEEELYRVNAFDWNVEFSEIMRAGGFDAVIGNPPYLRIQGLQEYYEKQIPFFIKYYQSAVKRFDLYLLFTERGFSLLRSRGYLGFICPHKFINSDFGSGLRSFLLDSSAISTLISFGNNLVFNQASTYTGILLLHRDGHAKFGYYEFSDMPISELPLKLNNLQDSDFSHYEFASLSSSPWVLTSNKTQVILEKLNQQPQKAENIFEEILVGVQSGIDNVHVLKGIQQLPEGKVRVFSERANAEVDIEQDFLKPFLRGEDVHRFSVLRPTHYCIYPYQLVGGKTKIIEEDELRIRFPLGYAYLNRYREELRDIRERQKTNLKYWYSCHRSRDMRVFESERIVTPEISLGCNMTVAQSGLYHNTKVYSIIPSPVRPEHRSYWLGILNSKLLWWFLANTGYVLRGGYFVFKTNYLNPFPIRIINISESADKKHHDDMVALVERMLDLHKRLPAAKTAQERVVFQRQIETTDRQIDSLVYDLYGLTPDERKIVEEATK